MAPKLFKSVSSSLLQPHGKNSGHADHRFSYVFMVYALFPLLNAVL